jgi:1-aminocyclopropane-1-carboxylate deaminase/D-cysteine desulfhydrase-like pyridoxal-dependent ACC family enzyme
MAQTVNRAAELLGLPHRLAANELDITQDFIGLGYGAVTAEGWEATDLLARTEGVLLDPVYTAKAMAGLMHDIRRRRLAADETVVFIHTGGLPAVFAYRDELLSYHGGPRAGSVSDGPRR